MRCSQAFRNSKKVRKVIIIIIYQRVCCVFFPISNMKSCVISSICAALLLCSIPTFAKEVNLRRTIIADKLNIASEISLSSMTEPCDGTWTGSCCKNNRPGPATGPSPICRMIMHSDRKKGVYYCKWYNAFCHFFCNGGMGLRYNNVKYCGYFGNK